MKFTYRYGTSVCKGCEDRHIGCHGTCERYKVDKAEKLAEKDAAYRFKADDVAWRGYVNENRRRNKK